jgi:methylenetetrahydrofolate dehydrogenase (NADP+)/methenyltetrahydrofolate cyclohydrolase
MKIIDGKLIADKIKDEVKLQVDRIKEASHTTPKLAVILVGEDPASHVYVNRKHQACQKVGIDSENIILPAETTETELLKLVHKLNKDKHTHGILVQLPLPGHINEHAILEAINPDKDVDGFNPWNVGKLMSGYKEFVPATPAGIMTILDRLDVNLAGMDAVVVGRSNIVGKPMGLLLLERGVTVTTCHSRTADLKRYTKDADLVIVAAGVPNLLTADMVKKGVIIIDVGINRLDDGSLVGDVDFEGCKDKAGMITPVPGGVGPMTIATLLENLVKAFKKQG